MGPGPSSLRFSRGAGTERKRLEVPVSHPGHTSHDRTGVRPGQRKTLKVLFKVMIHPLERTITPLYVDLGKSVSSSLFTNGRTDTGTGFRTCSDVTKQGLRSLIGQDRV